MNLSLLLIFPFLMPLAKTSEVISGTIAFKNLPTKLTIPDPYRLEDHQFPFETQLKKDHGEFGFTVHHLRFPSSVTTKQKANNTVHCEWFRPNGEGPFPAVVVLDILGGGGDNSLARLQCNYLVKKGIACLFVQMSYYGPRRTPGSKVRMIMPDIDHTIASIRQTVLDIRRASAWLESRPEVDKERIGIVGTSLGSFIGSLTAEMEPRFKRVAIVLGGGGLVDAFYDHPKAVAFKTIWEAFGGDKTFFTERIGIVDPLTRAENLKGRQVLLIGASRDEIVPPSATTRLWKALGEPKIVWYDATHYTAAFHLHSAFGHVIELFKSP